MKNSIASIAKKLVFLTIGLSSLALPAETQTFYFDDLTFNTQADVDKFQDSVCTALRDKNNVVLTRSNRNSEIIIPFAISFKLPAGNVELPDENVDNFLHIDGTNVTFNKKLYLLNCKNVSIKNITFCNPSSTPESQTNWSGYALALTNCSAVAIDNCRFKDIYESQKGNVASLLGACGIKNCSGVTFTNCTFNSVGYTKGHADGLDSRPQPSNGTHMIYLSNSSNGVYINQCTFQDCSGFYIKLRNDIHDVTIRNSTFSAIGEAATIQTGPETWVTTNFCNNPFIGYAQSNTDDIACADHNTAGFGERFTYDPKLTITNNTFSFADALDRIGSNTFKRVLISFQHDGFEPKDASAHSLPYWLPRYTLSLKASDASGNRAKLMNWGTESAPKRVLDLSNTTINANSYNNQQNWYTVDTLTVLGIFGSRFVKKADFELCEKNWPEIYPYGTVPIYTK